MVSYLPESSFDWNLRIFGLLLTLINLNESFHQHSSIRVSEVYRSLYLDFLKNAEAWLQTVPLRFHREKDNLLVAVKSRRHVENRPRVNRPRVNRPGSLNEVLAEISQPEGSFKPHEMADDPVKSMEQWIAAMPSFSVIQITEILKTYRGQNLPIELQGQLIIAAFQKSQKEAIFKLEGEVSRISLAWGRWEPEAAAGWALTLPTQRIRENAIQIIYFEWRRYDIEEAEDWGRSLPANYRRVLQLE